MWFFCVLKRKENQMNTIIILFLIIFSCGFLAYFYKSIQKGSISIEDYNEEEKYDLNYIVDYVNEVFNNILRTNLYEMNLSRDEFKKKARNKEQLRKALKTCSYGNISDKNYVKDFIKDILLKHYGLNEGNIDKIINFSSEKDLSGQDKFEILMHNYKKAYEYRALEEMIKEFELDKQRKKLDEDALAYFISPEDINKIYHTKIKSALRFEDKISIITQRIYQMYKGFGVIDEIRDMKIDGVSGGVSGIPPTFFIENDDEDIVSLPMAHDSIWIFYKGKPMHIAFLSFTSEKELRRVCKNVYRYNNPGQLNESKGFIVNEMMDGSRVVVAIPPFCESWVFLIRKFDSITAQSPEALIKDKNIHITIELMKWLIKGCRVIALTGGQGTGKTTLLMSIVQFINATFTLRIQEMASELHLRKLYPTRNIISFRETGSISGQEGLNLQKKTDGTVNILGEIASAPVASWMIQMAQVASLFTIFTHHAKTASDLVLSIRNNLLQENIFNNEKVAEKQVADVINFNIHLNNDNGHRFIERITEIIPLDKESEYPVEYRNENDLENKISAFMDTMREYFVRVTDRKVFETRDIIRFIEGEYRIVGKMTDRTILEMERLISVEAKSEFKEYLKNFEENRYY
jgi:pilus assembly protein CpaF